MINSLNPKEIERKIQLNSPITSEEINLLWYIYNFKIQVYYFNGIYFKANGIN